MCNYHDRSRCTQTVHGLDDKCLGFIIEGGGSFVHDQYCRIVIQRPGNSDSLTLATGNPYASFSHDGLQPFWKGRDKHFELSSVYRTSNRPLIYLLSRNSKSDIRSNGVINEIDILGN